MWRQIAATLFALRQYRLRGLLAHERARQGVQAAVVAQQVAVEGDHVPVDGHDAPRPAGIREVLLAEGYLRPSPDQLNDEVFLRRSTAVMFRVVVASIAQIANQDRIGQFSASNIVDGVIKFEIPGTAKASLTAKNGVLTYSDKVPKNHMSSMTFADVKTARDLFDGRINAVAAVGNGGVKMAGMISQIDNINRILSRVELYLK